MERLRGKGGLATGVSVMYPNSRCVGHCFLQLLTVASIFTADWQDCSGCFLLVTASTLVVSSCFDPFKAASFCF